MANGAISYSADDSTGATIAVAAGDRKRTILRNFGPNTVYLGFGQSANSTRSIYLKIDDSMVLDSYDADFDLYLCCATGETADVRIDLR